MSIRPSPENSPSATSQPTPRHTPSEGPEASAQIQYSRESAQETPRRHFSQRTASTSAPSLPAQPLDCSLPDSSQPLIIVTGSPEAQTSQRADRSTPLLRQSRSLVSRPSARHSSSQQRRNRSFSPYPRQPRSATREEELLAMSSAGSSPGNTGSTTSTSGSGSNPGYHLPYAPFPYPMPNNGGSSSSGGKGK